MTASPHMTTPKDIHQAATALRGVSIRMNLDRFERLPTEADVGTLFKREGRQKCCSFKVRGAYAWMSLLSPAGRERGIMCVSTGNHVQGLACARVHLDMRGTIYLPSNTSRQKRCRIAAIGEQQIEQVIVDGTFDRMNALAQKAARVAGHAYIHPYDDPSAIVGQGTIDVELEGQMPEDTAAILVSAGGDGLIAGTAMWLCTNRPEVKIIGVKPAGATSTHVALEAGQPVSLAEVDPFVDDTAVGRTGSLPFHIASRFVDSVLVVLEDVVCTEMLELYQLDGVIAKPAGALVSTTVHMYLTDPADRKALLGRSGDAVVYVVSGDNNDLTHYTEVIERSLCHEGLCHHFLMTSPQQPDMLRVLLSDVLGPVDDIMHFECTRKNNRELGPVLVGIDLSSLDDIDGLRHRMEVSPLYMEELPLGSEITRLVI